MRSERNLGLFIPFSAKQGKKPWNIYPFPGEQGKELWNIYPFLCWAGKGTMEYLSLYLLSRERNHGICILFPGEQGKELCNIYPFPWWAWKGTTENPFLCCLGEGTLEYLSFSLVSRKRIFFIYCKYLYILRRPVYRVERPNCLGLDLDLMLINRRIHLLDWPFQGYHCYPLPLHPFSLSFPP